MVKTVGLITIAVLSIFVIGSAIVWSRQKNEKESDVLAEERFVEVSEL